jgi:hypothetical protein
MDEAKRVMMRDNVTKEIVSSERDYLKGLEMLVRVYLQPIKQANYPDPNITTLLVRCSICIIVEMFEGMFFFFSTD